MDNENEIGGASGWPFERVCPECGKVFAGTLMESWIYRDRGEMLCSWGCVRRREKRREEGEIILAAKKRAAKRMKAMQKQMLVRKYVFRGLSNREIADETGMSIQLVNYYRKMIEEETD